MKLSLLYKDLDRNSPTEDLLEFAKEFGYRDIEGMDASPAWMSQELDERAYREAKLKKFGSQSPLPGRGSSGE